VTYEAIGASQVSAVGQEEKCAFTLNVTISASGILLPFQAIFLGKLSKSLPDSESEGYKEAHALGFQFESLMTDTYWTMLDTMKMFIKSILVPYFDQQKVIHSCPGDQCCIWQIDIWPIHAYGC
jgi:hypothetical protein